MQYEQANDEIVAELPKKSIDTGMGLERVAAVLQGVTDNYDTDTFKALIHASEELTRTKAEGEQQASHRVIADHLRASGFLVADGVLPANEGRGYVLRRIMRRAMRHAHLLGAEGAVDVPAGAGAGRGNGRGLSRAGPRAAADRGDAAAGGDALPPDAGQRPAGCSTRRPATMGEGGTLAGETAFKLYDTFGFPYDLTEDALRARGIDGRPRRLRRRHGRAEGGRPARRGRARATRRRTICGSTSPRSMARPSSSAIRATRARAWCSRSSRTARAVERAGRGRDGPDPAQPDALLWRERRPGRRSRKTELAQGLRRRRLRIRRSRWASSTRCMTKVEKGEIAVGDTRPAEGRRRAPRPGPRQSQRDPLAPRRAAPPARRACHAEGQPGRADDYFRFDFSHPKALTPRGNRGGRGRGERADPRQRAGRRRG